jgi:RNA polymerase sigma factor (sigma-70 family)
MREIVHRRYFLGQSQEKIARRLGVSQMQVSRLERRALDQLREQMRCPAQG